MIKWKAEEETGDLVRCMNCMETMVVDTGVEVCPFCHAIGTLAWVDSNPTRQEINYSEFEGLTKN